MHVKLVLCIALVSRFATFLIYFLFVYLLIHLFIYPTLATAQTRSLSDLIFIFQSRRGGNEIEITNKIKTAVS